MFMKKWPFYLYLVMSNLWIFYMLFILPEECFLLVVYISLINWKLKRICRKVCWHLLRAFLELCRCICHNSEWVKQGHYWSKWNRISLIQNVSFFCTQKVTVFYTQEISFCSLTCQAISSLIHLCSGMGEGIRKTGDSMVWGKDSLIGQKRENSN